MTPKEKARELVNTYYNHARSQKEAIRLAEKAILKTMFQKLQHLHSIAESIDKELFDSLMQECRYWESVLSEIENLETQSV